MAKPTKKFDPRYDELELFRLPKVYVVAELMGPKYPEQQLYTIAIYASRQMAEWHASDLRAGDTERLAKALAKLKGTEPLSEIERRNNEGTVQYGIRDVRVLESDKDCEIRLEVKLLK